MVGGKAGFSGPASMCASFRPPGCAAPSTCIGLTPSACTGLAVSGAASGAVSHVGAVGWTFVGMERKMIGPMSGNAAETPQTSESQDQAGPTNNWAAPKETPQTSAGD